MQCGKDCLLVKERTELYVILCVGRKISIHMSQNTREKGKESFCSWKFESRLETLFEPKTRREMIWIEISNSHELNRDHSITNATPLPSGSNSPLAFVPPAIGIAL